MTERDGGAAAPRLSIEGFRAARILYDQGGLLVVDKPTGIPTYGGDETLRHGCTVRVGDWLLARGRATRLGVHQRLDQDTSGALLFTTDPALDAPVQRALEAHALVRTYRAIVHDPRRALRDECVELWLEDDGQRARVVPKGGQQNAQSSGQRAVTHVRVVAREAERADVELRLETGRLHQIRVTLAHLGAAVLGDRLYGGRPAPRLMLHAWRLSGGPLPAGVEAPLPAVFERALGGRADATVSQDELITSLLDAATLRAPLLLQTNALRLLHGAADGAPGIELDVFGDHAYFSWPLEAPLDGATQEALFRQLREWGVVSLWAAPRRDRQGPGAAGPALGTWLGQPRATLGLEEGGQRYELPSDAQTLAFLPLEQRELRKRVATWADGGAVLGLGAAAGSAAFAALGRASPITIVDRSPTALARLRALAGERPQARLLREEPLAFAERCSRRGQQFAVVLLDLTLARGAQERAHLLQRTLALALPGGKVVIVRRPRSIAARELRRHGHDAASAVGRTLRYAKEVALPLDFPVAPGVDAPRPLVVELD